MRSSLKRIAALLFVVLPLTACADRDSTGPNRGADLVAGISVLVHAGVIAPGAQATVTIDNTSPFTALYGPCDMYFERWNGTRFRRLDTSQRVCMTISFAVLSGTAQRQGFAPPADAAPGTYRLAIGFTSAEGHPRTVAYSNEFDVQ